MGDYKLFCNARIATLSKGLCPIEDGVVVVLDGCIVFVGQASQMPSRFAGAETIDCAGRLLTPGLIDCHTHIVHAGDRSDEFELRLKGMSYEDVANAGGGIASTVAATRQASHALLLELALTRLDHLIAEGVTTVEVKSGYGLDLSTERRMLQVARQLEVERDIAVRTSFLGAHAMPSESRDKDAYIELLTETVLPALRREGLVDAVDGFCEGIAFSTAQIARLFDAAVALGLPVKLHADQLSDLGGAELAARYGALSADHLEYASEIGAAAMASSGTVAVLLPGAFYFLRESRRPPIEAFRRQGTHMAIATDCNPGSSPLTSILTAMNMAATLFGLSVEECLAGVTREAAHALGIGHSVGTIEVGKQADFAIWNVDRPSELVARIGFNPLHARVRRGVTTPR